MNDSVRKTRSRAPLWAALGVAAVAVVLGILVVSNSGKTARAEAAYAAFINDLANAGGNQDGLSLDSLRFALGYVDEDDIPELMVSYGTAHVEGVRVYAFDPESRAVEDWGEFSSFGTFDYFERQGVVVGQYGGMGRWYHIYEQVGVSEGGKVLALEGVYSAEEDTRYYWQAPYNGTVDTLWYEMDFDSMEVTQAEYTENILGFLSGYTDQISVGYDDMTAYTAENLHTAFRALGK